MSRASKAKASTSRQAVVTDNNTSTSTDNTAVRGDRIIIDGDYGEGGGQVLRNTTALAAILCKPIAVTNIRAKRPKPGLRPQHLTGIQLVNRLCNGRLDGARADSCEIVFTPNSLAVTAARGLYEADTRTAGSCTLLIQVALPCLLFADKPTEVVLKGGTNVDFSPPVDELTSVFQPISRAFGFEFGLHLEKRGFYPKGGGVVRLSVNPVRQLKPITLINRGNVVRVRGVALVTGATPARVANQLAARAKQCLRHYFQTRNPGIDVDIDIEKRQETNQHSASASFLTLTAETDTGCVFGATAEGSRKRSDDETAEIAVEKLTRNLDHGGCVDEWTQDQLIIFMALARGKSAVRTGPLTEHTRTAIHFVSLLSNAAFSVREEATSVVIECEGIGLVNESVEQAS